MRPADRLPHRAFHAVSGLAFGASLVATAAWSASMTAMGGMPMAGGWSMSMTWMRMPGQTWAGVAASFLGMWMAMTAAMMLPSLVPMLRRYREAIAAADRAQLGRRTAAAAAGYFAVWLALGAAVFPVGVALSTLAMQYAFVARAVPAASGAIVLVAALLQFSAWKRRHLAGCRPDRPPVLSGGLGGWRYGVRLGVACASCCAGFTAILLAAGMMDLAVMAAVAAAITVERLAGRGDAVARALGAAGVAAGAALIATRLWR
jgi:predicted metal-binding membrane protein